MISKNGLFVYISGLFAIVAVTEANNKVLEQNIYQYQPLVCTDNDCQTMANAIIAAMNKTVDPCENFYEYACGAWIHSNAALPSNRPTWNRMTMVMENISKKLRVLLESKNSDEEPVEKAKQWYRSCMYEEGLESHGIQPLTSLVTAVGGWPIAMARGQWNSWDYTWQEIELYYSRITGSYAMYDLVISTKRDSASWIHRILLNGPHLPLSDSIKVSRNFFDPEDREPYAKLIAAVARAFATAQGASVSNENITKDVDDMIKFEIKLNRIKDESAIAENTIARLQFAFDRIMPNTEISKINLFKLIQNMVEGVGGIEITEEEIISVKALYLIALGRLLNKTPFRTIVNYVHWYYLSGVLHATNSEMMNSLMEFERETLGIREPLPRWVQCVDQMKLNHALSYQFVQKYFTEDTYNSGLKMISKIQSELERQINGSTWMDEQTKDAWKEKLWNVKALIGFPDWYNNVTNLVEYYDELTMGNDYFNNHLNYMKFASKKAIRILRTYGQPDWLSDPITVNAIYIINANSLNIPAADFQPPIFTPMIPDAVKYGIIGSMLGHELSHGFDDTGCHFDKDGNIIYWPENMMTAYFQRTHCFFEQYNNLTISSIVENAFFHPRTVGENIADTTGIQSVLGAYKTLIRENIKSDRKLPGLEELSNEQLFLLSYATIWCEMSTPKYARKKRISGDPHSSSRVRVLAALSNIEGFAEAFNCPKGSAMNPAKKCNIWTGAPTP